MSVLAKGTKRGKSQRGSKQVSDPYIVSLHITSLHNVQGGIRSEF